MSFNNRLEFVNATSSEKIVLAHLQATSRLYTWELYSGFIYKRITNYFVYDLKQNQTDLTEVFSIGAVVAGTFYYDIKTSTVYVRTISSTDPATEEMIVTYQFYFSNVTIGASHDLTNTGEDVLYQGRITANPGFKHKVGIEQALTSLVGTGDLVLENNDGGLDTIFDTLFFENQTCLIYSWNTDLSYDEAILLYRGRVTNKSYDGQSVSFTIKDQIFDLLQTIQQNTFTEADGVNSSSVGRIKRWVYGRADGLQAQSTDQIGEGYLITGTVTTEFDSGIVTGTGTLFLSELSPNDVLTVGEQEFSVESIQSDIQLTTSDELEFSFSGETATVIPEIPTTNKNRNFYITNHAGSRIVKTLVSIIQTNRIELNNTTDLFAGDYLEFSTGERVPIKNINQNNIVVLQYSLISIPAISSNVTRQPIQNVYIGNREIIPENYTLTNQGSPNNRLTIELDSDVEFVVARARDLDIELTFTNGSRNVTTTDPVNLADILSPRDWIRPADIIYTTYYEILSVSEQSLELRVAFADATFTGDTQGKLPDYISDDTIISVNVLGKTEDGEPNGEWITTAAQAVKDICQTVGLTNFNNPAFDEAENTSSQLLSLMLPLTPTGGLTPAKNAIDLINKSIYGSLTLDNNLDLQYRILKNDVPTSPRIIRDSDVVSWKIKSTNGKSFRNSLINYRHQDYNIVTEQSSKSVASHSSDFVRDYIGTNQTSEFDVYLYDTRAAEIMSHRYTYFNRLGRSDITIESDLRLEDLEIGDVIKLEFSRLYKRFGGDDVRKKLMLVIGLTKTGERLTIEATDLNNTFNTTAVITPNTANPYSTATVNEKLQYGYITTEQGIVNDDEATAKINLIS
jgi:hypothetical protein